MTMYLFKLEVLMPWRSWRECLRMEGWRCEVKSPILIPVITCQKDTDNEVIKTFFDLHNIYYP